MLYYNRRLKHTARTLRKNMTQSEILLWSRIRRKQLKGYQFYRQKTIGNYIVDFYCPSARLIIEVDGSQHYEPEGIRKDKIRDEYLRRLGFQVLRFPSTEVFINLDGVVEDIFDQLPDKA
jgi:very-short-patch-repair endonuclease